MTPEGESNIKTTRNGLPLDDQNMYEVRQIMGNCVTRSLRNQYINENVQFVMWIFDEGEPLKTRLIDP